MVAFNSVRYSTNKSLSLDLFWLHNCKLTNSCNLPEPSGLSQPTLYYCQNIFVELKIYSVDLWDITSKRWDDIAVAYMLTHLKMSREVRELRVVSFFMGLYCVVCLLHELFLLYMSCSLFLLYIDNIVESTSWYWETLASTKNFHFGFFWSEMIVERFVQCQ